MGLDSVELVMEVEKHFSISIPDREAEKAYTVGKLVDCVANILEVKGYDFSLREKTFTLIMKSLLRLDSSLSDFSISAPVIKSLNIKNTHLIKLLEDTTQLKFPGIYIESKNDNGILPKLKKWFHFIETIDFEKITWKKYIDIILADNLERLSSAIQYNSKYEIYVAIMRITVDRIGVDYEEIGIEKSFADDLGVD